MLFTLVVCGVAAMLFYFSWWSHEGRIQSFWLALSLVMAGLFNLVHLVSSWFLYLNARHRGEPPPPDPDLTVDVFVTACREPLWLIERSLGAACRMQGRHRTWLLDDGDDPELEKLARRLGAGYLTRPGQEHAKAGNLNAALARTDGEVVVIFDADHAPQPEFLERSIGHFTDPRMGFVQVMLTFANARDSWVARAAAETTYDFYNPTSMGADGIGGNMMIGSNALIRRTALESIGGYRPGLAEDLATSIAVHAAGWRSAYVAEPLAPGLAPQHLSGWFVQQMKWSRGVFEVLLTQLPRALPKLTWGQRIAYIVRTTYYWIGLVTAIHLAATITFLFAGSTAACIDFGQYLVHILPLALLTVMIRQFAIRHWRHPDISPRFLWRPMALVIGTFPIYCLAWCMAVLRVPLRFHLTPKSRAGRVKAWWLLPQLATAQLLFGGVMLALFGEIDAPSPVLVAIAMLQATCLSVMLWESVVPEVSHWSIDPRQAGGSTRA